MGFISKVELKRQLQKMGIIVEGNYVRRSDIGKILAITTRYEGVVKWYKGTKEWGYISCPEIPRREIGFKLSDLANQKDEHKLVNGAKVSFEIEKGKFEQAVKVELL